MKRPVISIAATMVLVAGLALALASLRNATTLWASAWFTLDLLLLVVATIMGIVGGRPGRGSWIGAAVMGGAYLLWAFGPWWHRPVAIAPPLLTSVLLDVSEPKIYATDERIVVDTGPAVEDFEGPSLRFQSGPSAIIFASTPGGSRTQVMVKQMKMRSASGVTIVDTHQYRRVGHALIAFAAFLVGGVIGRLGSRRRVQTATQTSSPLSSQANL